MSGGHRQALVVLEGIKINGGCGGKGLPNRVTCLEFVPMAKPSASCRVCVQCVTRRTGERLRKISLPRATFFFSIAHPQFVEIYHVMFRNQHYTQVISRMALNLNEKMQFQFTAARRLHTDRRKEFISIQSPFMCAALQQST